MHINNCGKPTNKEQKSCRQNQRMVFQKIIHICLNISLDEIKVLNEVTVARSSQIDISVSDDGIVNNSPVLMRMILMQILVLICILMLTMTSMMLPHNHRHLQICERYKIEVTNAQ